MKRAWIAGAAVTAIAIAGGILVGSRSVHPTQAAAPSGKATPPPLVVPRAFAPIAIDGEIDELGWTKRSARTNGFLAKDGTPGRPYADARLVWDDQNLYVALYAGDEDVRAAKVDHDGPLWLGGDYFHLVFTGGDGARIAIDVSPACVITDARRNNPGSGGTMDYAWESGARAKCDVDGVVNDDTEDEEWVVEMAIPLASLGGTPRAFGVRRCDTTPSRVCTAWNDENLAPLVLDRGAP